MFFRGVDLYEKDKARDSYGRAYAQRSQADFDVELNFLFRETARLMGADVQQTEPVEVTPDPGEVTPDPDDK